MDMCCTDVDLHEFEYKWTITNLSLHFEHAEDEANDITLTSSSFATGDFNNTKWHIELLLHCNNHNSKDYIGVSIVLDDTNTTGEILASQTYYFICNTGIRHNIIRMRMHKFETPSCRWGSHQVYRKKKLLKEASIYLPNDQLTIVCRIHVMGKPIASRSSCYIPKLLLNNDLQNDLKLLLEGEKFADITFVLYNEKIKAHKNILTARSPVFTAMFQHEMIEKKHNIVNVNDIEPDIFKEMLYYIYTNDVNDIDNIAMDLLPAADKYGLEKLKAMCGEAIYKKITIDNAAETLIFADRHSEYDLIVYTQNFINTHISQIMNTPGYNKLEKNHPQLAIMLYRQLANTNTRKKIKINQDNW